MLDSKYSHQAVSERKKQYPIKGNVVEKGAYQKREHKEEGKHNLKQSVIEIVARCKRVRAEKGTHQKNERDRRGA